MAFAPLAAQAEEELIEFTSSASGSRTLALAVAPTFPATDISVSSGTVVGTPASTTVTELLALGADFSVLAQVCGPDDYADPQTADCADNANKLVRANAPVVGEAVPAADSLAGSTIAVTTSASAGLAVPFGTVTNGTTPTTMAAQRTLFSVDEDPSASAYNGVYTAATGLTINGLTKPGTWKGYWVVTLQY